MSLKDAYQQRLEAQMEEQMAKISLLRARAKRMMADGKIMGYEEIADADQKAARLKEQLKQMASASGDALGELKSGIEKALVDLGDSCQKASAKFGSKH